MSNPITDLIPPKGRKWLNGAYASAALVVGALAVAGVDVHKAPDVLVYVGGALALSSASNVRTRTGKKV